jgi:two-component system cell cycle response regulator
MDIEKIYLSIINNLQEGVYIVDLERRILFWNEAAETITGYTSDEIIGKKCFDSKLDHIDQDGRPLCTIGCPLFSTMVDCHNRQARVFLRHKDGYRIPVLVRTIPIVKNEEVVGGIEIFSQDSPVVYNDDLVKHLSGIAMHDAVTQLPNRRYLESFLSYKYDEYLRFGRLFAILFADIDNFSNFNNNYGHDLGDKVLVNIAATIKKNSRKDDLVGRWGGEEFLGVYSIVKPTDASLIGEKFRQMVLHTEVPYSASSLHVSMSVGVAVIRPEDTVGSILERADHYMYEGKKAGKNCVISD